MDVIAYKGFNKELACTLGKGVFRYQVGQTYKEELAECARTGFHCVEEPIEVLQWYREGRYAWFSVTSSRIPCLVSVAGPLGVMYSRR